MNTEYFEAGDQITLYVDNPDLDYASRETQVAIQEFNSRMYRCDDCQESWIEPNTMSSWYIGFLQWAASGECTLLREGLDDDHRDHIRSDLFYPCLYQFLDSDSGTRYETDIRWSDEPLQSDRRIVGYKQTSVTKTIDSFAKQGPQLLQDMRSIENSFGLEGTFSYGALYLDYETYFTLVPDTIKGSVLSILAVSVVIFIITSSLAATFLVLLCVLLVDYFLLSLLYFWGLTFNSVIVVNMVIAVGLSVDYSAHIAHTYLTVRAPKSCVTKRQIRHHKARVALSQMGSSVFHGGFSTFLAISTLAPSASYVFEVFFKCWFGIIVFGMANGFLLLPIILSEIGPTKELIEHEEDPSKTAYVNVANESVRDLSARADPTNGPEVSESVTPIEMKELQKMTEGISEVNLHEVSEAKVVPEP